MAAFEARAGVALIRKLANASGDFGAGLVVEGIFDDDAGDVSLAGGMSMVARDPTFDVLEADLTGRTLCRGDALALTRNGLATDYLVRTATASNTAHGTLTISLEKDPTA